MLINFINQVLCQLKQGSNNLAYNHQNTVHDAVVSHPKPTGDPKPITMPLLPPTSIAEPEITGCHLVSNLDRNIPSKVQLNYLGLYLA